MAELEVFWDSGSPYVWRVLLALEVKQLPYTSRRIQFSKDEQKTPEFLAMNPRGKIPVVRFGGFILYESTAILAWLDREWPERPIFGRDASEHGQIWRAVAEIDAYLQPEVVRMLRLRMARAIYFDSVELEAVKTAAKATHTELGRIEGSLGQTMVGDEVSAADIVLLPAVQLILRAAGHERAVPLELGFLPLPESYPKLAAWLERMEALPGYDRTYPPHWRS
jgi:glutathione S-transferase